MAQPQQQGPSNGFSFGYNSQQAPQNPQPAAQSPAAAADQHNGAHAESSRIMTAITTALAVPLPPMPDAPCFTMGWYAPRNVPAVAPVNSNRVGARNPGGRTSDGNSAEVQWGDVQQEHQAQLAEVWPGAEL
jgi:hypothetical protein